MAPTIDDQPPELPIADLTGQSDCDLPADVVEEIRRAVEEDYTQQMDAHLGAVPRAINWKALSPLDMEQELLDLNAWVDWLRHEYGLPAQIIPPLWHRHSELLWELSALKQSWLMCYDPQAKGNAPIEWHQIFHATRERLRDWVAISGSKLDRDRPTRHTPWPGGEPENWTPPANEEHPITNRTEDFLDFIDKQVRARQRQEDALIVSILNDEESARHFGNV